MTARDQNKLLGIFFLVYGGLTTALGVFIAVIYGGLGTVMLTSAPEEEARMVGGIFMALGLFLGFLVLVFSIFNLITGWKIYKEAKIGRILGIISSVLCLWNFPLGLALGIYGLWFLFSDPGKALYEGGGTDGIYPPPPNSWQ